MDFWQEKIVTNQFIKRFTGGLGKDAVLKPIKNCAISMPTYHVQGATSI